MSKVYGYARISRKTQNIERQVQNIEAAYPDATIKKEAFTGTKIEGRKALEDILKAVEPGDTIVFDSVSRMSRNADEGLKLYFDLFDKGIELVFLKEPYINTETYRTNLKDKVKLTGGDEDDIFIGINNYFRKLAKRQILIAFQQAQKEVDDLHERTREGIREVKRKNELYKLEGREDLIKQVGQKSGAKLTTKKSIQAKELIRKHSKDFGGSLNDAECMKLIGLARNTFYKYKKELREEMT